MAEPEVGELFALVLRYGYLIVAISALAEALPLLGWLVPGQAIIILAGAAAAGGYLDLWTLILIAIPAGILGDALGFYIGRHYGRAFLEKHGPRLRIGPRHLEKSDALFARYGPFALIVARFNFVTRAIGPILAGMARMRARVFWPINLVGAVAWAVAYSVLGFTLGVGFLALQEELGRILAFTVLALVGLVFFYRMLKKYAAQFTRDDLYVGLLGGAAGAVFGVLADRVQRVAELNVLDVAKPAFEAQLGGAAPFFRVVEALTSFAILGALSLGVLLALALRRRWWEATLVGLGVGGIILLVETLRRVFADVLPPGPGDSFPSGSAAIPLVLAGVATYLAAWRLARPRAALLFAAGAGLFAAVALLARLAQGDEYPSSVLAGLALGTSWLCVSVLVVEFRLKRNTRGDEG